MSLENRLELRLTQKLILTPQLQQAIKLLQMPHLELSQYLNQELVENPLLEEVHDEISLDELVKEEKDALELEYTFEDTEKPLESFIKFTVDEYFEERASDGRDLGYFTPGTVTPPSFEQFTYEKSDLYDHLLWQLRLSNEDEEVKKIGEMIIGNLDENGYLTVTLEEIRDSANADMVNVEKALSLIQSFDPTGVGARNLKECLLLQVKNLGLDNTIVENIIKNDLNLVEKKKYSQIAQKYDVQVEDVMRAIKVIEGLEPKPGRNYSKENVNYVIPDVSIFKTEDGYQIVLNDEGIPKLRINNFYKELIQSDDTSIKEDKKYIIEKMRSAVGLLKSLDHRYRTIYRVTEALVELQKGFFDNGVEYLKPLTLKDVAVILNLHESTISRVTSNKFFFCEHGIFPFKFLFCSGLSNGHDGIASNSVKNMIKKIISEENPARPLSDKRISDLLKKEGITIARRTVAKYREEMGIPAQFKRKRIIK